MQLSEFSVRRPVTTLMIVLSILVLGVLSLKRLPLTFLPEISGSRLTVYVPYRSSSPEEVEQMITIHIEDVVSTVSHLKKLSSTSSQNNASVSVEFENGTDMDLAAMEIRNRLDLVWNKIPSDVERILIRRWQTADMPVFNFNVSWDGTKSELNDLVRYQLQPRIQRIEGVANVELEGIDEKKVLVELDQGRMQAHNVDAFNLIQSLRNNNINLSAGSVFDADKKYSVRIVGEFLSLDEIARVPIRGTGLHLKDVATIAYGTPEKTRYQRLNGKDALSLTVHKASNANVVDVCNRIKSVLKSFHSEDRFNTLNIQVYRDQSEEITKSLNELRNAGIIGAFLAILVLYIFLRKIRSTLIIAIAIPIAILFALFIMFILRLNPINSSITLNLISMMGMVYAVGMLVDPSIVVLENIYRYKQEEGLSGLQAAIIGSREVSMAVLAATVTSMIVFLPLLLMEGGFMANMMYEFGIVVCAIMFSSLIISLTVVPLLASRIFTGKEKKKSREMVWLSAVYSKIILWTLGHRIITVSITVLILLSSFYLITKIDREFQPPAPSRNFNFMVEMPKSYSINDMSLLFADAEQALLSRKENLDISAISSNFGRGRSIRGRRARLSVYLKEDPQTNLATLAIVDSVKKLLPQRPGVNFQLGRMHHMSGQSSGLNIELKGDNLSVLQLISDDVIARLSGVEGLKDLETGMEDGQEEIQIVVNRTKVNRYGLSSQRVANSIQSALTERAASRFKTKDREIDIQVNLKKEDRADIEKLRNLSFENQNSDLVPLYTMADIEIEKGPQNIQRESRRTTLTITGNLIGRGMMTATDEVTKRLAALELPAGYSWSFGENFRSWRQSESSSLLSIVLATILILMVMAALFESLIHPFTMITSVVFAITGVFLIFWISGTNLSSTAYLGILIVCGLVVNNGIILVDHINQLRRAGLSRKDAIVKGGMDRIRPILMTAATTNLGLLPMVMPMFFPSIFGPIEGRAGMWAPVGLAVFGGLTTSTFLTLIILPTIYSIVDDLKTGIVTVFRRI